MFKCHPSSKAYIATTQAWLISVLYIFAWFIFGFAVPRLDDLQLLITSRWAGFLHLAFDETRLGASVQAMRRMKAALPASAGNRDSNPPPSIYS